VSPRLINPLRGGANEHDSIADSALQRDFAPKGLNPLEPAQGPRGRLIGRLHAAWRVPRVDVFGLVAAWRRLAPVRSVVFGSVGAPAGNSELDVLRAEVAQLRAENERLRDRYRIPPQEPPVDPPRTQPVRVLLLPDPARPAKPGRAGPEVAANVARILISHLRKNQPEIDWRAEHNLAQIPTDAECFHLGDVLRRTWDGTGPLPKHYRIAEDDSGERRIERCLVDGDAESDHFRAAYERQLRVVDELLTEGEAAHGAEARHHAGWTLKAVDVVLAQAKLALASFRAGRDDWKTELDRPRPEYDPRYHITSEHPAGW
jgi:hypothetical protein